MIDTFVPPGFQASAQVVRNESGERLELRGGGYCGWLAPGELSNPHHTAQWAPLNMRNGFLLPLRLAAMNRQAPPLRTLR